MEASKNGLERIVTSVETLNRFLKNASADGLKEGEEALLAEAKAYAGKFEEAMDDDFNTADAISAVFELVKFANTHATAENSKAYLETLKKELTDLCDILGVIVEKEEELLDADIENLIAERQAARKAKDFARADEIRNELLEKGIILKDTREGVQWKRA